MSRAAGGKLEFKKPEPREILTVLKHIVKAEKVRVDNEKLKQIAKTAPSVREAVGMLQQQCVLLKATNQRRRR